MFGDAGSIPATSTTVPFAKYLGKANGTLFKCCAKTDSDVRLDRDRLIYYVKDMYFAHRNNRPHGDHFLKQR